MLWWIGAALLLLMSVACGLNLGARVAKGEAFVWQPDVFLWAIGLHGTLGVAALWMITRTVR